MELLAQSGFTRWPPRLPEQPIFYPVTNEEYAAQIASRWNTGDKANGSVGYVTKFEVQSEFLARFNVETVGGAVNTEYWIPAEQLEEFNDHIVGKIEVIREFR